MKLQEPIGFDIALVQLSQPIVVFTAAIKPICLPKGDETAVGEKVSA